MRPGVIDSFEDIDRRVGELTRQLEKFSASSPRVARRAVATGLGAIDASLPDAGLACGKIHEWIGVRGTEDPGSVRACRGRSGPWSPPLTLLVEIVRAAAGPLGGVAGRVVWIGEAVWPYPAALAGGGGAGPVNLDRCLFVRGATVGDRLWATDLALRSCGAAVVVADGSGFDLGATRRLQLAAEAGGGSGGSGGGTGGGGGCLCLLARPAWELAELSAASTRWLVSDVRSSSVNRRWTVELVRCKGLRPTARAVCAWAVERDRATRAVRVAADVLDRPAASDAGEAGVRRTA